MDKFKKGSKESIAKVFTEDDVLEFSRISCDNNPIHLDEDYAKESIFKRRIVHGILVSSLISAVIANKLPGIGSIYLNQTLKFSKPVFIGDNITAIVEIIKIKDKIINLKTICINQTDEIVLSGEAIVMKL